MERNRADYQMGNQHPYADEAARQRLLVDSALCQFVQHPLLGGTPLGEPSQPFVSGFGLFLRRAYPDRRPRPISHATDTVYRNASWMVRRPVAVALDVEDREATLGTPHLILCVPALLSLI